jgi:hypothetical protein
MNVYEESLSLRRELGDQRGIALGLLSVGEALRGTREWQKGALAS